MPQTPEERRETFRQLAEKRQQFLDDERVKQETRERAETETTTRQKQASIAEQTATEQRGEQREEWRQEQHTKHQEALEAQRKAAEEAARQKAKAAKDEAERQERAETMRDLHDRAKSQKVASRKLQARHVDENTTKNVGDQLERDVRDLRIVLDRTTAHLVQDRQKKIAHLEDDAERQRLGLAERYAKKDPSGHKRALMTLDEHVAAERAKIEAEYVRLKDEASAQGAEKEARLRSFADQRLREARTRHENMDEWIDSHRN